MISRPTLNWGCMGVNKKIFGNKYMKQRKNDPKIRIGKMGCKNMTNRE